MDQKLRLRPETRGGVWSFVFQDATIWHLRFGYTPLLASAVSSLGTASRRRVLVFNVCCYKGAIIICCSGTCTLQITSAVLIFEFNVKDDMICLSQLQNCPKNVMKNQIGQYYTLPYLMRVV